MTGLPTSIPVVLLVEDYRDDREMYADYLRGHGFHVVATENASQAFALAHTAHVVVTDIRVAGAFDGIKLLRRLRSSERTLQIPVIVVTASVTERERQRATDAGCTSFLPKPCLPESLAAEIQRVLARI
jgi:two-component system, cell cycle response regulator DivK